MMPTMVTSSDSAIATGDVSADNNFLFVRSVADGECDLTLVNGTAGSQLVIRGITSGAVSINSGVATYIDETPYTAQGSFAGAFFIAPNLDTFDMLSPRYDRPATKETFRQWAVQASLTDVDAYYSPHGVVLRARASQSPRE